MTLRIPNKTGRKNSFANSLITRARKILNNKKSKKSYSGLFSRSYLQSYVYQPGKAVWMPREYHRFADEGYGRNVIVYRCISLIAQSAASVPWLLYHTDGEEKKEIRKHPLLDLLARPNPSHGGSEFIEHLFAFRMISGNVFVQAVGADSNEPPKELHILRPDRVTIVAGSGYFPKAYRYTVGDNYKDFYVNQLNGKSAILHIKNFHPLNDYYGLSPIESAAYSIDQHNQAAVWNQALLQNGARPSGALVVNAENNGTLTDDQYNRIKAQMDEQFSGAINSGRPLLLEGGLDWKEMSISPKDMDFISGKHSSARDIALAFGVPPQLLGIPGDNTYNNFAEARLALWESTIIPLLQNVTDTFNNWLSPMFGEGLKLDYDLDEVSALTPRREKMWAKVQKAEFMTINEKRQAIGLDSIEGGDKL